MPELVLRVLDIGFFVFHSVVIVVNVTGWIWARTRKAHMAVLGVTAFSWFALGPLLGFPLGYCFCTDWHWQIRRQLGYTDDGGYIQLLFQMAGMPISAQAAAIVAYCAFAMAVLGAIVVNIRGRRTR
jgi:Protein of Unknown function (DUF2784)